MNLIYEVCIKEAKALPDFRGTDDHYVCITLNGLVLDRKMLLLINTMRNGKENEDRGTPLKELHDVLLGHNRGQIQVLLRELKDEKRIILRGTTKAAKWFIFST